MPPDTPRSCGAAKATPEKARARKVIRERRAMEENGLNVEPVMVRLSGVGFKYPCVELKSRYLMIVVLPCLSVLRRTEA